VIISKDIAFTNIKKSIESLEIDELKEIYPSDFYYDDSLKENFSLTLRFVLQSDSDSISEEKSNSIMDSILGTLKTDFNAELR